MRTCRFIFPACLYWLVLAIGITGCREQASPATPSPEGSVKPSPKTGGPTSFQGLSTGDYQAIFLVGNPMFGKAYFGMNLKGDEADGSNLSGLPLDGTFVMPSGQRGPFRGRLSADRQDRWMEISWRAERDGCGPGAEHRLRMAWPGYTATIGTGRLVVSCGGSSVGFDVKASLVYDLESTEFFSTPRAQSCKSSNEVLTPR